jgi:predicted Zn-dependent peptidase
MYRTANRNICIWFYFILLISVPSSGLALQTDGLEEKITEYHLDNGLTLLVAPRSEIPTFTAFITLGVGSANEHENNRGIAHLLEHMRFKGTETIGTRDYAKEKELLRRIDAGVEQIEECKQSHACSDEELDTLEKHLHQLQTEHRSLVVKDEAAQIYARHGGVGFNAYTSKDLTTYLVSLPANKLELWVSMEADRMKNTVLREFYTEKEVILEERKRSYETRPRGMMYEALLATAFRVHPYRHPIIGWNSDIRALTKEQTRQFMHAYYMPQNAVIALVGDVDPEEALHLVEQYFGDIPPGVKVPEVRVQEPAQNGERRAEVVFDANPRLLVGYHKPTVPHRDDYAFDLLSTILGQGASSRLHRSLVLDQGIASSISVYTAPGARYPNLFVIGAIPRHPHTSSEVEREIYAQLEQIKQEGVRAEELEQARKRLRADRIRHLRSNRGLASMLTHYEVVTGSWRYLVDYDETLGTISTQEVQTAAQKWLTRENRSVVTLRPSQGQTDKPRVNGGEHAQ